MELLIGAAVGALVVGGLAASLGAFSHHVETVRADADGGPDEALALMLDMSRHGWDVQHAQGAQLSVSDADGATTAFALDDQGVLAITRPSGAHGALLHGVEALTVETETVRRLREAEPVHEYRSWWQHDLPAELLESNEIDAGLPLALGFHMDSAVPDSFDTVDDVDEHAEEALLETLVIPLAYLGAIPPDPNEPITGDPADGGSSGGGKGKGGGKKVQICHVPPGNPDNAHTLEVSENAVDAHLAHGDSLGACGDEPTPDEPMAELVIELYEARAHDDARPFGPSLGSMSVPASALPAGQAIWVLTSTGEHGDSHAHGPDECASTTPNGKVVICHVPPGNPANAHTIAVGAPAVAAHLAHGDSYGCCGQHGGSDEVWVLETEIPDASLSLDLSPLNGLILPGRAYTLVFALQGEGSLYVSGLELDSSAHSGVAQAALLDGELHPVPLSVPFELKGTQTITQTSEHHPVTRVALVLEMQDGRTLEGSANVVSQVAIPDAWNGPVPDPGGAP